MDGTYPLSMTAHKPTVRSTRSLNDCKNLFKVTSTHIQWRFGHWHWWTVLAAKEKTCVLKCFARTYHHITKSHTTWPSLTLVPRNNSVLFCRGGDTGAEGWSKGTGVGCHGPATLPKDNSSLLTSEAMTGHTKQSGSPSCLPGGRRTLTDKLVNKYKCCE